NGLVDERIWYRPEQLGYQLETGQQRNNAAKSYSEAVLSDASNAPETAALLPSANFARAGRQANTKTVTIPCNSAPSTAQIAATTGIWVMMGLAPKLS